MTRSADAAVAPDESDTGWGDPPADDDEERLRADRPPHHDRV
ncbi:MAG: hypothetical protein ABR520_07375 [Mycobacteriales bacterium]